MGWCVSGTVNRQTAGADLDAITPGRPLSDGVGARRGEGAEAQLVVAKRTALGLIGALDGDAFGVVIEGHSQADVPGSGPSRLSVSVSVKEA